MFRAPENYLFISVSYTPPSEPLGQLAILYLFESLTQQLIREKYYYVE